MCSMAWNNSFPWRIRIAHGGNEHSGHFPWGEEGADFLKKHVYCRIWRFAWLDQYEHHNLENMQRLLGIARSAAATKCFAGVGSDIDQYESEISDRSIYDRLRYPNPNSALTLSKVLNKAMRAETERSMVICAISLKRYALRHGRPPASLDSLVPRSLSSCRLITWMASR